MEKKKIAIVLGMFDGVHVGHAMLFEKAKQCGVDTVVAYTFKNHPAAVYASMPPLLSTAEEREKLLMDCGADRVVMDTFDTSLQMLSPQEFVQMLCDRFGMTHVVIGYNYTFGKGGKGNTETMQLLGRQMGFDVIVVSQVYIDGQTVSSSRIRRLVEQGNVAAAAHCLGRPFSMCGIVERCRGVGRKIGFPTANIKNTYARPLPKAGVYATRLLLDGKLYDSVTNVGTNPTFGELELSVETHIFNFDEDCYGKHIEVQFFEFMRPQQRFASVDELVRRIAADKLAAQKLLLQLPK